MDIVERLGELRLGNKESDVVINSIDQIERLREALQKILDPNNFENIFEVLYLLTSTFLLIS